MEENNKKNLTNSKIDRQNMLNNSIALEAIQQEINVPGIFLKTNINLQKNK